MQPPEAEAVQRPSDFDPRGNRAERFCLGSLVVVPARGLIRADGVERRLTPQQMEVLVCLARRAGEVVSKEELLAEVWNGAIVEEGALARSVSELRSALGDDARAPKYVQTVAGHGYRLITAPVAVTAGPASDPRAGGPRWKRWRWTGWSALLLLLLGVYLLQARSNRADRLVGRSEPMESALVGAKGPVVAVLGFQNLSGDSASDWLSTAMPELLANELAVSSEVRVVPTQSVSRLTRDLAIPEGETLAPETLRQVKSALGADFVVLGSFLSVPGQIAGEIRLDARVQDARSAEVVTTWTETVAEAEVISSLSRAGLFLRQALGVHGSAGSGPEIAAYLPKDPTALRLYYQGVRSLRQFEATAARDYLSRSLALEPNQPFALLALSQAWAALGYDSKAIEVAQSARDQSAGLPRENRLLVEASFFAVSSKWSEAIERYRALWLLAPDNLDYAVQLARSQNSAGLPEEALATLGEIEKAGSTWSDPRVFLTRAESAARTGDHERALAASRLASERAQVLGSGLMLAKARQAQAIALYGLGKVREASVALEEARIGFAAEGDHASEAEALTMEADWVIQAGHPESAKQLLEASLAAFRSVGDRRGEAKALTELGNALSSLGDFEGAKGAVTQAISTFVEVEDNLGQASALGTLAYALGANGRPHEAEPLLREAAQIFDAAGAIEQAAVMRSVLGMNLSILARPREGLVFLEQAETVLEGLGSRYQLGRVKGRKAVSFWCQGDLARAEKASLEALSIALELDNPRLRGFSLLSLARIETEKGHPENGMETARLAESIAEDLSLPNLDVAALVRQTEAAIAAGHLNDAVAKASQAVKVARASEKFLVGAYEVQARALMAVGDWKLAATVVDLAAEHDDGYSDASMALALVAARLRMNRSASADMVEELLAFEERTKERGYWVLEMDSRIIRGELEQYLGNHQKAQAILEEVVAETEASGWVAMGARARKALEANPEATSVGKPHSDR